MAILTENWKLDAWALLVGLLTVLFFYAKRAFSYWDRQGFKVLPNVHFVFGHFRSTFTQKESAAAFIARIYKTTNAPFIGMYATFRPILLVRSAELVQSILIKDFTYFTDRGVYCNEEKDPLSGHLFALPGQKWKNLRGKLSPAFTSGKLKGMFSTLLECGSSIQNYLETVESKRGLLDVREIAAGHTTNIIASVAFGIEADSITNPNNEFRACGRKIFESSIYNAIRMALNFIAPHLMSVLQVRVADESVEKFIRSVVKQNLEHREQNNVSRKDFFQLLVQLRNNGTVQLDDQWETVIKADENQKTLSVDEIAAQTFLFFAAGFETSSTTLAFCMYELAKNQEIQGRVHDEIDRVLSKHNGEISYESILDMKYLEACIDETLRKYPILPVLNRTCVHDYCIPGTSKVIAKGTEIFIPAIGLQMDAKYYENPDNFDPNRYLDGNAGEKNFLSKPYMPFGVGPRNCIGMRLGKMQTKVGLVMMLKGFRFELEETLKSRKMEFDPKIFLTAPLHKIQLQLFKRQKK